MVHDSLIDTTTKIHISYLAVYDILEADPHNDDAKFIKELPNILIDTAAVLEVYARDKYIHEAYALEKLKNVQGLIQAHIRYWENVQKRKEQEAQKQDGQD